MSSFETQISSWEDLFASLEFASEQMARWGREGDIRADQANAIADDYLALRQRWQAAADAGKSPPQNTGLPSGSLPPPSPQRAYRLWWFLGHEIHRHQRAGRLSLAVAHALLAEGKERVAVFERQMTQERSRQTSGSAAKSTDFDMPRANPPREHVGRVPPARAPGPILTRPSAPRRPLLEILLDPRSIQWLLAFGGASMVVGLVILLWRSNFFTPPKTAVALGLTNVAMLVGGWTLIKKSHFQTAGRALTLLACLVMPLNLWYYHAQDLITLDGNLWATGLVCCALYAATAWLIKDEIFVYVFSAGVTLTGLLMLASTPPSPDWFWTVHPPATMLIVLGLLGIHVERAFAEGEGPFTRGRFGLAFFWSGHAQLAVGLLLILGAQVSGNWLYEPIFKVLYQQSNIGPSPLVAELRWLALLLVAASTWAYLYSDLVVRKAGVYVYLAGFSLLWTEFLLLEWLGLAIGVDAVIAVLALTALIVNLIQSQMGQDNRLTRSFPTLGVLLCAVPVALGCVVYLRHLNPNMQASWATASPSWSYLAAMLLAVVACRVGAHLTRHTQPKLCMAYFFLTGAATLVAAVSLLAAMGLETWREHAPILMLIPIGYLVAARLWRGHSTEQPLVQVSHAATVVMLVSSLASSLQGFVFVQGDSLNLYLSVFFAEAALFYGLATAWKQPQESAYGAAATACAAAWQLMTWLALPPESYTVAFALVGLALLAAYRFAVVDKLAAPAWVEASFQAANVALSLSFLAAVLMGLSKLATHHLEWSFVGVCVLLTVLSAAAVLMVPHAQWRRWYVVTTIGLALLVLLALQVLGTLTAGQKTELFLVGVGAILLIVGHIGWYREQERQSDMVDLGLWLGALLVGLPLAIATLIDRSRDATGGFAWINELGFLAISLALLGSGFMLQLKSTTIVGAGLTVLYFLALLFFVPWGRLNTLAVCLTVGGGLVFGTGILLSMYRDRLLALPGRLKNRQGIFRVLTWR